MVISHVDEYKCKLYPACECHNWDDPAKDRIGISSSRVRVLLKDLENRDKPLLQIAQEVWNETGGVYTKGEVISDYERYPTWFVFVPLQESYVGVICCNEPIRKDDDLVWALSTGYHSCWSKLAYDAPADAGVTTPIKIIALYRDDTGKVCYAELSKGAFDYEAWS